MAVEVDAAILKLRADLQGEDLVKFDKQMAKLGLTVVETGKNGEKALAKIDESLGKGKNNAKQTANSFVELSAKVFMAVSSFKKFADAAVEKRKADMQLEAAVKNNTTAAERQGKSVRTLTAEYKDFAEERERTVNIDDAATEQQMKLLLSLGTAPGELKRVTKAFQDMSATSDISVETMARAWSRLAEAPDEALGALSKVGIKLKKEMLDGMSVEQQRSFILDKIEGQFRDQAAVVAEAEGAYGKFKLTLDKVAEGFGEALMPAISAVLAPIADIVQWFNDLGSSTKSAILSVSGMVMALYGIVPALTAVGTAGAVAFPWVTVISGVVLAIGGLISALDSTESVTKKTAEATDKLTTSMSYAIESAGKNKSLDMYIAKLARMRQGSDEYTRAVNEMLSKIPELKAYGVSGASTFDFISSAVGKTRSEIKRLESDRKKAATEASKDAMSDALMARFQANVIPREQATKDKYATQYGIAAADFMFNTFSDELKRKIDLNNDLVKGWLAATVAKSAVAFVNNGKDINEINIVMQSSIKQLIDLRDQFLNAEKAANAAATITMPTATTAPVEQKSAYDMHDLRVSLIRDEFQIKREAAYKFYSDEKTKIAESSSSEEAKIKARGLLDARLAKDIGDITTERDNKLHEAEKARIEQEKQARIDALNAAADATETALSIGTSIIKKDWKNAIGETLSAINPAIGGIFQSAVSFIGEILSSSTDDTAKLLEETAKRSAEMIEAASDKAQAIIKSSSNMADIFKTIYGEFSTRAVTATTSGLQSALDAFSSGKYKYGGLNQYTGADALALFQNKTSSDYIKNFQTFAKANGSNFGTKAIFDQWMTATFGDLAPFMGQFFKWSEGGRSVVDTISGTTNANWDLAKTQLEEVVSLLTDIDDSKIAASMNKYKKELADITHLVNTGDLEESDAEKQQIAIYDSMIKELETLEQTEAVKEAINKLEEQKYALQKKTLDLTNQESDALSQYLNGARGDELKKLLADKAEIERAIAAGELTAGSANTVTAQQGINSKIIALLKALGADSSIFGEYQTANANLSSEYYGNAYAGMTGQGITPLVQDYLNGVVPTIPTPYIDPAVFLPTIPATSTREYTAALAQRAVAASSSSTVTNSNNNTNSNNVVINGQAVPSTAEQFEKTRVHVKQTYGVDLAKGA